MKKVTIVLMVLAMLLGVVACGQKDPKETNTSTETKSGTGEEEMLPQVDLKGKEISIYTRSDTFDTQWNAEYSGDAVDNAVYRRNSNIEAKLNTYLNFWCSDFGGTAWGNKEQFKTVVMAGQSDGTIDIIDGLNLAMASWVPEGLFTNLLDFQKAPYLDFTKEYWPSSLQEKLTIDGSMYVMTGEADIGLVSNIICMYFNKDRINTLQLEDPYELVQSKEWTLEKLLEMSQNAYADLGDPGVDDNDWFGFMIENENQVNNFLIASGIPFTVQDGDGQLRFNLGSTAVFDLVDKLNVITGDLSCRPIKLAGNYGGTRDPLLYVFYTGHSLFTTGYFDYAQQLSAQEIKFGVLPYPTDNEGQDYHTGSNSFSMYAISSGSANIAESSAILEALGYYGYSLTSPAYFERGLQKKYSETDVDSKMFDIIRKGLFFDLGDLLGPFTPNDINGITPELRREIAYSKGAWASTWQKNQEAVDEYLKQYIEGVIALKSVD